MIAWLNRRVPSFVALLVVLLAMGHEAYAGTTTDVAFTVYTPLSSNLELARRLLSPLTVARIPQLLAHSGSALSAQPIDLSHEKFVVYVPSRAPPNGYALLVFVPPWPDAKLPDDWDDVLDRYGVIFVSAARSGNDASVLGRREPLALLAERNIARRYPIDPRRIYIGGFSGGSRIAMRLALGYPDVFRGALLDAGSDPIGDANIPLPPKELFLQFQSTSHLIYLTGADDVTHLGMAAVSKRSMQDWCVFDVDTEVTPETGHDVAGAAALSAALAMLLKPVAPDPAKLAACRSDIESALNAKLRQLTSLIAEGKRAAAQALLNEVDKRYGGLAAPRSLDLAQEIDRMRK